MGDEDGGGVSCGITEGGRRHRDGRGRIVSLEGEVFDDLRVGGEPRGAAVVGAGAGVGQVDVTCTMSAGDSGSLWSRLAAIGGGIFAGRRGVAARAGSCGDLVDRGGPLVTAPNRIVTFTQMVQP